MQCRAIFEALCELQKQKVEAVIPEIMIPLIAATLLWVFFKDKLQKPDDLRVSTILKR